jgi:hypothetical protein
MKFNKQDLIDLLEDDHGDFRKIKHDLIDTSRWSLVYQMIFQYQEKYYQSVYRSAATEIQDERPYEYDPDEIECAEVKPIERTVIDFVAV